MRGAGTKTHDDIQRWWGGVQIMLLSPRVRRTLMVKWAGQKNPKDSGVAWTLWEWRERMDKDGGKKGRLAPQPCVVAVQAGTQRPARHEQLGARVVVAVRVDRVWEGMNIWEVAPPRLIVILKPKQMLGQADCAQDTDGKESIPPSLSLSSASGCLLLDISGNHWWDSKASPGISGHGCHRTEVSRGQCPPSLCARRSLRNGSLNTQTCPRQCKTESEFTETHQDYYFKVNSCEYLSSTLTVETNVWFS